MKNNNKNQVVNKIDELVNEKQALNLQMSKLQREKDLKIDTINKHYENKIDKVLRRIDFIDTQMEQASKYARKNLIGGKQ